MGVHPMDEPPIVPPPIDGILTDGTLVDGMLDGTLIDAPPKRNRVEWVLHWANLFKKHKRNTKINKNQIVMWKYHRSDIGVACDYTR